MTIDGKIYRGVRRVTRSNRFQANFVLNKKNHYLGTFTTPSAAALAVKNKKLELGEVKRLRKDLNGQTFGRLRVLSVDGKDKQNRLRWRCCCSCGNEVTIDSRHLVQGRTVSCGCYCIEVSTAIINRVKPWKTGKASHLYKHNLTDEDRIRHRIFPELPLWRKKVFARDNYTCDLCSIRGGKIVAHHLNCWAGFKDLRFKLDNGVTLCKSCHHDFHMSLGGCRNHCTKQQYEEYRTSKPPQTL